MTDEKNPAPQTQVGADVRPSNCRFRLQGEGKPFPKSSCAACGKSIVTGLGKVCSIAPAPESNLVGSETAKAIALGASVLSRIEDPAAREIAIRNALTEASKSLAAVPQGAVPVRASEQAKIDAYKAEVE